MKISPVAQGTGTPGQNLGSVEIGRTASADKMARAKAIAQGETPEELTGDNQVDRIKQNVRSIKMRTQRSPESFATEEVAAEELSTIPESTVEAAVEATQPLSPQFAALAKQKRALQVKERELADREKALSAGNVTDGSPDLIARLKSQPLSVLQEHGVTYDQLTEAILAGNGISPEIQELKAELKALKEGVDKTLVDRDTQAEQAALNEMRKEATLLSKEGETFEMVRETGSIPQVMDLIHRTYKQTGEVLDVQEALELVENELVNESLKIAKLKKVQGKLTPPPPILQPQPQKGMRTLTSRDSASTTMSAKARAIAAFNGTLKR